MILNTYAKKKGKEEKGTCRYYHQESRNQSRGSNNQVENDAEKSESEFGMFGKRECTPGQLKRGLLDSTLWHAISLGHRSVNLELAKLEVNYMEF